MPSDRLGRPLYSSQRGSYLRRSNRIVQFATKISPELDRQIRDLAYQEQLYLAELLEKMFETYLYCKDKDISIERERERERRKSPSRGKNKAKFTSIS